MIELRKNDTFNSIKISNKVQEDRKLVDIFKNHLDQLGWVYSLDGFCEEKGVTHGKGLKLKIHKVGMKATVLFNHKRNKKLGLRDCLEIHDYLLVLSLSENNLLGYTSKGISGEIIDNFVDVDQENNGWKRKLKYEEMKVFNIERRLGFL